MNFKKVKKISQISFIVFNILVLLTLFIPSISLDKYVEYDFNYGYVNEDYKGYTTPIATKITPADIISNLFLDQVDLANANVEYYNFVRELNQQLESGAITEEEYHNTLSSSRKTNKYMSLALYFGGEPSLSRFKSEMFLYSILLLVFYILTALMLVLNIINYKKQKKLLSIANVFYGWIQTILMLVFNIYTFSLAISSVNNIEGFEGKILEETTLCMSPKLIPFLLLFSFVAYALVSMYVDRTDTKLDRQNKEIPVVVSQSISNQNRYRKINSKKSKYKNGSKKKRHR